MRDYSLENKYLTYPTEEAMECFSKQRDMVTYIIRNHVNVGQIKNYMKTILCTVCDYNFIKCLEHKNLIIAEMQDLLCRFFLYNWCKDTNKIIKGIRTHYEVNDRVQEIAHQYYKKRNKK
ncbi:unnamed protein product [Euphydryas editha]|uniref:Uncharacterized protein n=1 Tax=Euphydryas editha TaxID=104508 RepID=A0AAU9UP55_EUPED|nr:unnamed protein product [Euphydryas editha]